jgi:flagellar protein FlgJ
VEQLFKAMRETVPREGLVDGGSGEEMFTGMLDQHLAGGLPETWGDGGLADALFRQLRGALGAAGAAEPAPTEANRKEHP